MLQAAGLDDERVLSAVVAIAPNVHVAGRGRALYDYASEAALYLPCALLDARFHATPFARRADPSAWQARCATLHAAGLLAGADRAAQAAAALERLQAAGWNDRALAAAASSTGFDLWRALASAYASAYLRRGADAMPGGVRYGVVDAARCEAGVTMRAAWWSDASGIPPGAGVALLGGAEASADPHGRSLARRDERFP